VPCCAIPGAAVPRCRPCVRRKPQPKAGKRFAAGRQR
jgi:hypothetical protein